jgi:hypothetical protein
MNHLPETSRYVDQRHAGSREPVRHDQSMTDGDWRLTGQHSWLAGRDLRWRDWTPYRPGWDHDHCVFCHAEFATTDHADFTAGYVTTDDYTWICKPCYEDFQAQFRWNVLPDPTDSLTTHTDF